MVMYANEFKTKENQKLTEIQKLTATYTITNPCLRVFLARLNYVYLLETIIAKSKNKMSFHLWKWQALLTGGTQLPINTCY